MSNPHHFETCLRFLFINLAFFLLSTQQNVNFECKNEAEVETLKNEVREPARHFKLFLFNLMLTALLLIFRTTSGKKVYLSDKKNVLFFNDVI